MQALIKKITSRFKTDNERDRLILKNILGSTGCKGVSILVNLLLIPISISLINEEQYGIWLTISAMVLWLGYFNVGLTHGFRNKFAEAKAHGDFILARKYVSTTYLTLSLIFIPILLIVSVVNHFLDWSSILNIDVTNNHSIKITIYLLVFFFCVNFILNTINSILAADQRIYLSNYLNTLGQLCGLVCLIGIRFSSIEGSMPLLAVCISGVPCLVNIIVTIVLFMSKYKEFRPSLKFIDFSLNKNIISLGVTFFIIQITNVVLFQLANLIILRNVSAVDVTEYNIACKYFGVATMLYAIVIDPYWSAFTDAFALKDYAWMTKSYRMLQKSWYYIVVLMSVMLLVAPFVYRIWIGESVSISMTVSFSVAIYYALLAKNHLYMNILNGMSLTKIQMYTNMILVLIVPFLMVYLCKEIGVVGAVLSMAFNCIILNIVCSIYLKKRVFVK